MEDGVDAVEEKAEKVWNLSNSHSCGRSTTSAFSSCSCHVLVVREEENYFDTIQRVVPRDCCL